MPKADIASYKMDEYAKKDLTFKHGTSYIINPNSLLINQINRNIVFGSASYLLYHYSTTLNYERIYKISADGKKQ